MSRRLAVLSALVLALVLAAGTLTIASAEKDSSPSATAAARPTTPEQAPAQRTPVKQTEGHGGHGGAMMRMVRTVVVKSLAARLQVTPAALEKGAHAVAVAQFTEAAERAGLTGAQTKALKACHAARRRARQTRAAACDRSVIRPALKQLKALPAPDLAALKTELSDSLAAELGTTGPKVVDAARAELVQRLGQAVGFGALTKTGETKALACFDTPATCDAKALRAELRGPLAAMAARGHHGQRGHRR